MKEGNVKVIRTLNIIAIIIIAILLGMTFVTADTEETNRTAETEELSFNLIPNPEEVRVKAGETVEVSLNLKEINMGENGLNSLIGYLGYNESLFKSVAFVGNEIKTEDMQGTVSREANKWNVELNTIKNSDLYGKFCIYTIREGVTEDENIAKLTLVLKDDLQPQTTKVTLTGLASSDGEVEVEEEDRAITIIIYEEEEPTDKPEDNKPEDNKPNTPVDEPKENTPVDEPEKNENVLPTTEKKVPEKQQSPQTGDTKIIIAFVVLIVTVVVDIIFMKKTRNSKLLSIFLVILIGVGGLFTKTYAEDLNLAELISRLQVEETWLNSEDYLVTETTVSRIAPNTKISEILDKFNKEIEVTTSEGNEITEDTEIQKELKTGMKIELKNPAETDEDAEGQYLVSVWGDTNEDGKSNQVELTKIIRNRINSEKWSLDEHKFLSADLNSDNTIDGKDINASVRYIVYEEMDIPEFEGVEEPQIEVASGTWDSEQEAYISNIGIKITEQEENAKKTIYKVKNQDGEIIECAEIEREEDNKNENGKYEKTFEITGNGVYKISAYTVGELGNRSEIEYTIVCKVLGKYNYEIHYFYDGEEDLDKKVSAKAKLGETINVTLPSEDGEYILDTTYGEGDYVGTEGLPITITDNVANNVANIYYIKPAKYNISGEVIGGNGTISDIAETVYSGRNSTKDIVFTPNEGYRVKEMKKYISSEYNDIEDIKANGEEVEIYSNEYKEDAETGIVCIKRKFKNVTTNIHITVEFEIRPVVAKIITIPSDVDPDIENAKGEKILNHEYYTLEEAIADAKTANDASTDENKLVEIILLDDVRDESNIVEGNNVSIDLQGHEINSKLEDEDLREGEVNATLVVKNASLIIKNTTTLETGKVNSENGYGVYIKPSGIFTLGVDDGQVSQIDPQIQGKVYGIYKETERTLNEQSGEYEYSEGIFNYYDGKVTGVKSGDGDYNAYHMLKVDNTPEGYSPYITENDNVKTALLSTITANEAKIEVNGQEYTKLEYAIAAANTIVGTSNEQIKIILLKDIVKDADDDPNDPAKPKELVVDSTKNIILDLNGHTLSRSNNDYVMKNYGKLQIIDSKQIEDETTGEITTKGKITSSVNSTILNGFDTSEEVDYNETIDLTSAVANDENYYFVSNGEGGLVSNNGKNINEAGGIPSSTARSYIELDLTNKEGIYEVVVDSLVSSQIDYDYGYITVSDNNLTVDHDVVYGRKIHASGKQEESQETKFNLVGGKKYYIHLGYYKSPYTDSYDDCFTINSIKMGRRTKVGELTLTSGTIENTKAGSSNAVLAGIENEGMLYINGGKVTENKDSTVGIFNGKTSGTGYVEINGGTIETTKSCVRNEDLGFVKVNGGSLNSASSSGILNYGYVNVTGEGTEVRGDYGIRNGNRGTVIIEKGTFYGNYDGVRNEVSDGRYDSVVIKGGNFSSNTSSSNACSAIKNSNSGRLKIENANVTKGYYGVYANGGNVVIDDINMTTKDASDNPTVYIGVDFRNNSHLEINDGEMVTKETTITNGDNKGTVEINDGNYRSSTGSAISAGHSSNTAEISITINGGNFVGKTNGIYNTGYCTVNVLGGIVEGEEYGILNSPNAITIVGEKTEATPSKTTPKIIGGKSAVRNRNTLGIFKYYDGVLVGPKNKVLDGILSDKPENYELVREMKSGLQHVTIGKDGAYVARIADTDNPDVTNIDNNYYVLEDGYYKFRTLKSAVEASSTSNATTIELIDDAWVYETIEIEETQNITIDLKDYKICLYSLLNFENNGTLKFKLDGSTTEESNIVASGGQLVKNNATGTFDMNNIKIDYITYSGSTGDAVNRKLIQNFGTLNGNNFVFNINVDNNDSNVNAYAIYNEEGGTVKLENSTFTGRVTNSIENVAEDKANGTYAVTVEDTDFVMSYYETPNNPVINKGAGTVLLDGCMFESITGSNSNMADGKMIINNTRQSESKPSARIPSTKNEDSGEIEINDAYIGRIENKKDGKITVRGTTRGGNISNSMAEGIAEVYGGTFNGAENKGTMNIYGGTFNGNYASYDFNGLRNLTSCIFNFSGSSMTISGNDTVIKNESCVIANANGANLSIKGGLIHTTGGYYAIHNCGQLVVGEEGGTVSTEKPIIMNTCTQAPIGGRVCYGISNQTGGTFDFYDGIIGSQETTTTSGTIGGTVSATEPTYIIVKHTGADADAYGFTNGDLNGEELKQYKVAEYAILEQIEVAEVVSTGTKYYSLKEAIANTADTDTVELLADTTLTSSESDIINIVSGKNITLDIKGYNITASKENAFVNDGTFVIKDSGHDDGEGNTVNGTIKSGTNVILKNNNKATIESGTFTLTASGTSSNPYKFIENEGELTVSGGTFAETTSYSRIINNITGGKTVINGGTFTVTGSNSVAIVNEGEGAESTVTINEAVATTPTTITGNVGNYSTGVMNITAGTINGMVDNEAGGTVNISGGTVNNVNGKAIYNKSTGTVNITGGHIIGKNNAIVNNNSGNASDLGIINIDGTALTAETPIEISAYVDGAVQVIYNYGVGRVDIKGHVNLKHENATNDSDNCKYAIYNKSTGIISIGDSTNITNDVKISAMSYGINNINGTVNYYGGTITSNLPDGARARKPVHGYISSIPDGKDILVSKNESEFKYEIGTTESVAKVDGTVYDSLQSAIDATTSGTIDLMKDVTLVETEELIIPSGKNLTLNLNGHTIYLHNAKKAIGNTEVDARYAITNNGTLKITDETGGGVGQIYGYAGTAIYNTGDFELAGASIKIIQAGNNDIIHNTGNGKVTISGGELVGNSALISDYDLATYVIYSDNTNEIKMSGGDINLVPVENYREKVNGIYATGDGVVINVTGGNFHGKTSDYYSTYDVHTMNNATINISGNAAFETESTSLVSSRGILCDNVQNPTSDVNVAVNISGNANINSGIGIQFNQYVIGSITVTDGTVSGIYLDNNSLKNDEGETVISVSGGNIKSGTNTSLSHVAITANKHTKVSVSGDAKITPKSGNDAISGAKEIDIQGGEITGRVSSGAEECEISISAGTITANGSSIYPGAVCITGNNGIATITGGTITSTTGAGLLVNNTTATAEILGGTVTSTSGPGIQITKGTVTIGNVETEGEIPSAEVPLVRGSTYGVKNDGGTFNFYDGAIAGKTNAYSGVISDTPTYVVSGTEKKYDVVINEDSETGEKTGTLGIKLEVEQVASVGNTYYDTLAGAIEAASQGTTVEGRKVIVRKQIRNSDRVVIPTGKEVTIDLATFSIIMENEGVIEIEDGAKLTIIDSNGNIATETSFAAIMDNDGTPIINNGTLILGEDDGRTYISPKIIGKDTAVQGNAPTIYDGGLEVTE